jgi:hypothetical protein
VIDKIAAMTRIAVVVPALLLTACSDEVAVPVSRTNGWKIAHSPNMPASMSGTEGIGNSTSQAEMACTTPGQTIPARLIVATAATINLGCPRSRA